MGDVLRIRNWDRWQSYRKDRGQPPWIKIHREVMRNPEWVELSDAQRGQLVAIWLLAADRDGVIPASPKTIQKLCYLDTEPNIQAFVDKGFIEPDANVTSDRRHDDAPEEEAETEAEAETEESHTSTRDRVAVREAFDLYNEVAGELGLPRAEKLTDQRKRKLRSVLNAHGLPAWKRALLNLEQSKFCLGEGGRGWRANLDFMLQPTSFVKLLEGAYTDVDQGAEH